MTDVDTDRRQLALLYRDLGWSVIPLNVGHKRTSQRWQRWQRELPSHDWIDKQWPPGSRRNIGVVCGAVSGGLVVRDWDDAEAYEAWRDAHPELSTTIPTVRTRRGCHQYIAAKDGRTGSLTLADGELKGCGTYVVAAGSSVTRDRSGAEVEPHLYRWSVPLKIIDGRPILPKLDLVESGLIPKDSGVLSGHFTYQPQAGGAQGDPGEPAIADLVKRHSITGLGQRNNALWRLARDIKARSRQPDDALVERALRLWLKRNASHCGTNDWLTNWQEFRSMVERIRVDQAFLSQLRIQFDHTDVPEMMQGHRGGAKFDRILRVLVAADAISDGGTFYLSLRDLAAIAGGMTAPTAQAGVRHAIDLKWLRRVETGTRGVRGKANKYRLVAGSEK